MVSSDCISSIGVDRELNGIANLTQTYSEPEKENKEGESPGFLILKQRAVACELYASDKG